MEGLRGGESGVAPGHGEDHESRPLGGQAGCTLSRRSVTNVNEQITYLLPNYIL